MTSVEMQEQTVPLKNAEHPQAGGGAESAAGAQQNEIDGGNPGSENKKEKKSGGWFSSKKVFFNIWVNQRILTVLFLVVSLNNTVE
jgi:hypothetical protein